MSETRWLDVAQQHAWRAFMTMQGQLNARLNRELQADSELSLTDFEVLVQVTDSTENRIRVFELARALEWEKSRLSHHLARMQRRGLVTREGCPSDARGAFIVLTPQGEAAIEAAAPQHVATVRRLFFDGLTDEQVRVLGTIADHVLERLADEHD
jgi:DNA-binding MarR family transcriptional regulator